MLMQNLGNKVEANEVTFTISSDDGYTCKTSQHKENSNDFDWSENPLDIKADLNITPKPLN